MYTFALPTVDDMLIVLSILEKDEGLEALVNPDNGSGFVSERVLFDAMNATCIITRS